MKITPAWAKTEGVIIYLRKSVAWYVQRGTAARERRCDGRGVTYLGDDRAEVLITYSTDGARS